MRITDPQVILNGEKDLIASVQKDLELDAVRDLFKERLTVKALSPKGGRIVVHDNDVAFRLDYEINLNGSLLFDRDGNLLEENESTAQTKAPEDEDEALASDLDDDLSINLPNYDDELGNTPEKPQAEVRESEDLPDDSQGAEPGLETEDLESDSTVDQEESEILEADDGDERIDDSPKENDIEDLSVDELTDIDLESEDTETKETGREIDDDISDILQESRNFWEKKTE
ncbi:hypothetical protein [Desulfobacter latus]|uniref:Uncharacterized protein n=1 Tax=Desulfobacter latus TaxID=2292 RepID=A0A850SZA6_9BACT|nr:hypothetical protein [Desulfobacter latus]NWH06634.1 hypothetical protein [Desulfobacter latus]